jgi:arsenite methyltransferase
MPRTRDEEIKQAVRERYSEVARGRSGCCGDSCGCAESGDATLLPLYTSAELNGLPSEAVMASAGCGNPTGLASLKPGETVVDFGSGGGIDCFLAARAVGPEGRVIGVDMTPDMVELARGNARKLGLSNVEFHLTEMEHTPLPDSSTDVIISNCVINLAPDKDAVFREAFRILRPGGQVFISDMVLADELPQELAADLSSWAACVAGAELLPAYLERMKRAGFADVEVLSEAPQRDATGCASSVRSVTIKALKPE